MSTDDVTAIIVSAIVLGSLYSLMASGLSIVWSVTRVFNFAHGSYIMLGAYFAWSLIDIGQPLFIAGIGAVVGTSLLAVVYEIVLIRPLLKSESAVLMVSVTTLAAAMININSVQMIWGPRVKQIPRLANGTVKIFNTAVGVQDIVIAVVAPLAIVVLAGFLRWTRLGFALRAVEQNHDLSKLIGISPKLAYSVTHAVSGALAGFAGFLLGAVVTVVPTMGNDPLLKAFIVVVLGGLGSITGTVVGAYAVGFVIAFSQYTLGLYWTPVVLFFILIVILTFRPTGIMGDRK